MIFSVSMGLRASDNNQQVMRKLNPNALPFVSKIVASATAVILVRDENGRICYQLDERNVVARFALNFSDEQNTKSTN